MTDSLLSQKHSGPLKVIIHPLGSRESYSFTPHFKDSTLFDYVGHACACIFTNMTTQLSVCTGPEDWEIVRFSPDEGILEILQVGGEELTVEEDDPERLSYLFDVIAWAKKEDSSPSEIPGIA